MRELIALTKESSVTVDEEAADALDDEYALFRVSNFFSVSSLLV